MDNLMRIINGRTYKVDEINIDETISAYSKVIQDSVIELQNMDYLFMDKDEFEMDVLLNNLFEMHPICEETLFSARTGKLVLTKTTIDYTLNQAKNKDEDLEDLKKCLNLLYIITEGIKAVEILKTMKTRKAFTPKLVFDSITSQIISREKIDFENDIVQNLLMIQGRNTTKYSFNEIYLEILADKLGISQADYQEHKQTNTGLITDMTFQDEVKYISLIIDEHIYNEKVTELSLAIFNKSLGLQTLLIDEVLKDGKKEISKFFKEKGIKDNVLCIGSFEVTVKK